MNSHKNALLTPRGREPMVRAVVNDGLSKAVVARLYNTTLKTVAKCRTGWAGDCNGCDARPPKHRAGGLGH